jgi:hypothetical protein
MSPITDPKVLKQRAIDTLAVKHVSKLTLLYTALENAADSGRTSIFVPSITDDIRLVLENRGFDVSLKGNGIGQRTKISFL